MNAPWDIFWVGCLEGPKQERDDIVPERALNHIAPVDILLKQYTNSAGNFWIDSGSGTAK